MGREIKRVSIDFAWPLNKVWKGFVNPHYGESRECKACDGTGANELSRRFRKEWYNFNGEFDPRAYGREPYAPEHPFVVEHCTTKIRRTAAMDGPRNWWNRQGRDTEEVAIRRECIRMAPLLNGWSHHLNDDDVKVLFDAGRLRDFPSLPMADEVNRWSMTGFGHDSINEHLCNKGRYARETGDHSEKASYCPACDGEGTLWSSAEAKDRAEKWEQEEPPAGDGWQLWETVSEGSPVSPVFASPEELARWLTDSGENDGMTFDRWLKFITGPGWAPSLVSGDGGVVSGVEAVTA